MKKIIETIIGIIIMLTVLSTFAKINYDYLCLKQEPSLYTVYISLLCTMVFLSALIINNKNN